MCCSTDCWLRGGCGMSPVQESICCDTANQKDKSQCSTADTDGRGDTYPRGESGEQTRRHLASDQMPSGPSVCVCVRETNYTTWTNVCGHTGNLYWENLHTVWCLAYFQPITRAQERLKNILRKMLNETNLCLHFNIFDCFLPLGSLAADWCPHTAV